MNALNTISQALVSRTTTGAVLLGYSSFVGHLFAHRLMKAEHTIFCHLPVFVLNMGTAAALTKAAFQIGGLPLKYGTIIVLAAGPLLNAHYGFVDNKNKLNEKIFYVSKIIGVIGFLFISAISQLKCIEKIAIKYAPTVAPKAFNFLPYNLLVLTGLMIANFCTLSLINNLARKNLK